VSSLTLADWTPDDDRAASREGWSLFSCDGSADGSPQVQRIDDPGPGEGRLAGDDAAWALLRGSPGTPLHARALAIIRDSNPAEYARVMNNGQEQEA
jgi:hypothetical protein